MYINQFRKQTERIVKPYIVNVHQRSIENLNFRTTLWTGSYAQMTVMCIPVCSDIGLEIHEDTDQIIRIEHGMAIVKMGAEEKCLDYQTRVCEGDTIFVPAGMWHNIINIGKVSLKISTVYAPPYHREETVHRTKEDAEHASNI